MTDAAASNFTGASLPDDIFEQWVICLCLAHSRRKFYELQGHFPQECELVLDVFSQVYKHEAECKLLSPDERLRYHQKHSAPLMEALRVWLNNQFSYRMTEPNSSLGQAITYLLRRWDYFTQFLKVPGAPLDNNLCEISVKVIIRYRNNSKQYHNPKSAQVGDAMMSVLHTARVNGINLFDYMTALKTHAQSVSDAPEQWLPWNYQTRLSAIEGELIKHAA